MMRPLLLLACLSLLLLSGCGSAESQVPEDYEVTFFWTSATYGTPAVHYVVEHQIDKAYWKVVGTSQDTTYTFSIPYFAISKVRVAGVDSAGVQGIFSLPSDPLNPSALAPGQPTDVRWEIK